MRGHPKHVGNTIAFSPEREADTLVRDRRRSRTSNEIDPAATAWLLASTALVLLMTPYSRHQVRSGTVANCVPAMA